MTNAHWIPHYECSNCGEHSSSARSECPFCHAEMEIGTRGELPSVGDCVVFNGTVCIVKAVDRSRRILTVEYDGHTSYIYAEDVDRFLL